MIEKKDVIELGAESHAAAHDRSNHTNSSIGLLVISCLERMGYSIVKNQTPREWNGEGLPPVCTACEAEVDNGAGVMEWLIVEVLKVEAPRQARVGEVVLIAVEIILTGELKWVSKLRPIRTEKEKLVEKIIEGAGFTDGRSKYFAEKALNHAYEAGMLRLPECDQ